MTSSLTFTLTGTTSVLWADFLPDIVLDDDCDYGCALLDLIIKNKDKTNLILDGINDFNLIYINCDIISNSYINSMQSNRIHQFVTRTSQAKGGILLEIPKHLNYFPLKTKTIRTIQISIVDSNGHPINIHGVDIICRIIIKRDSNGSIKSA